METLKTIKLSYPITLNGVECKELKMRRSKVRDRLAVIKMGGSDEEREIRLIANLCEVTPEVIEELFEKDYQKLQQEYLDFLK